MSGAHVADVRAQVMWNRLIAVVEEQAVALVRTAFSTSVRESGDLSAGVFDKQGRMIAQAVTGTPGHVNAMAAAVGHFIRIIGMENIFEGDAYITNDPWLGTGHLHDLTMVSPSFRNGKLIGFFASTAHVVDVGGRGFGPDANEVYEEGICIPVMKFAERGKVNRDLINILHNNVRESNQVVGDVYSLAACNETGHRRLIDMMNEFAIDDLEAVAEFVFERSRVATLERIAALPKGSGRNSMRLDGYGAPVELVVKLTIGDGEVVADFDGTSGQSPKGINVPLIYTTAYAAYGLKVAFAPDIPNNWASLEPFKVVAPPGCILNALRPAPVAVRHVLGHFVPDLILGAVHQMLPGSVPAEGAGALWNIHISARPCGGNMPAGVDPQRAEVLMFNSGGSGARPTLDGMSSTAFPSGVHTMSIEATEHVGPVIFWKKELREGSGGDGTFRGGLGQTLEIAPANGHEFYFNAMFDRLENPARGRAGGGAGAPGGVSLDDGTKLNGKGRQFVPAGRRLILNVPGGGGYGPPKERAEEAVEQDRARGYVRGQTLRV